MAPPIEIDLWGALFILGLLFGIPPLMTVTAGALTGWVTPRASIGYGLLVGIGLGILGSAASWGLSILSLLFWHEESIFPWPQVTVGLLVATGTTFLTWRKSAS